MRRLTAIVFMLCTTVFMHASESTSEGYVRMGGSIAEPAFQTAVQLFVSPDSIRPDIALVGVIHIAERPYYQALQKVLDEYDLVLYECASRPWFVEMPVATEGQKRARTLSKMASLAELSAFHFRRLGFFPNTAQVLRRNLIRLRNSMGTAYLNEAAVDDWGETITFAVSKDSGLIFASGHDSAIKYNLTEKDAKAYDFSPPLAKQMGNAMGLRYQLDEIRYDRAHFEHCDIDLNALTSSANAKKTSKRSPKANPGNDQPQKPVAIADTQAAALDTFLSIVDGSGISRIAGVVCFIIQSNPELAETVKYAVMKYLTKVDFDTDATNKILGDFSEIIIDRRNNIVLDRLAKLKRSEAATVGVFYGAAHLYGIEKQLLGQGYKLREIHWLDAVLIDKSKVQDVDLELLKDLK